MTKHGRHHKVQPLTLDFILSELELEYTFLDTKGVLCSRITLEVQIAIGSKNTKYTEKVHMVGVNLERKPTKNL